ncbi:MAG: DEAD/DEAH box helicase family protein [Terracidiphilus sp.]
MSLFKPVGELRPLRGRQIPVIPAIAEAIREGHKRIIVQMPTGGGKTVLAAHMMDRSARKGKRPMFVAPAIQLVEQTLASFEEQGLSDIGIIQAQHHRTDFRAQIQIASRNTLVRRKLPEIDFAIVDEVHDSTAGLEAIIDGDEWKNKIVIGLSATPWSRGLGLRWTKLIVAATMQQMIDDGAPTGLSPFKCFSSPIDPDMRGVKKIGDDYNEAQTAAIMSGEQPIGDAVETWLKHRQNGNHPGDRTFLYGVNRAHARALMEKFQSAGIACGYIDGETPAEQRKDVFAKYRSRETKVLCNVGVLITGVDEDVRCISDCAPTQSEIRLVQRWGRGARLADSKAYCLGLDHAGNLTRLGCPWDIHHDTLDMRGPKDKGEAYEEEKAVQKPRKCQQCFALIPAKVGPCPSCGFVYVAPNRIEHAAGELTELMTRKPPKAKMDEKQFYYSGLLAIAQQRGFKDGWVSNQFRAKFSTWPRGLERVPRTPRKEVKAFVEESRRKYLESIKRPRTEERKEA